MPFAQLLTNEESLRALRDPEREVEWRDQKEEEENAQKRAVRELEKERKREEILRKNQERARKKEVEERVKEERRRVKEDEKTKIRRPRRRKPQEDGGNIEEIAFSLVPSGECVIIPIDSQNCLFSVTFLKT